MTPEFRTVTNDGSEVGPIEIEVAVVEPAEPNPRLPLILCVPGWPEIWSSWRHQMQHFADRGFTVAAMHVRGYGNSSRPEAIEAYRLTELCADVATVIDQLSGGDPAILFGHDWGAPIVWNTARLHPDRVRAVAGLSVPYTPATAGDPMELWNALYAGRFFYMKYFQEPGVAEASFEADIEASLRKVYFAASDDAPDELWFELTEENADFFAELPDPDPLPAWLDPAHVAATAAAIGLGPSHGLFHRYRAQALDGVEIEPLGAPVLTQPTCFIGGARDVVRRFVPGIDVFADPGGACADFRGSTIVEGAGHWVQQEQPEATNAALDAFVDSIVG